MAAWWWHGRGRLGQRRPAAEEPWGGVREPTLKATGVVGGSGSAQMAMDTAATIRCARASELL